MHSLRLGLFLLAAVACSGATVQPLDIPFIRQEKNGCGAASVSMVMQYWGQAAKSPDPEQVYRRLYDADRKGIPLAAMKRYFEEHGFRAFTLRGQWSDVEHNIAKGRPVIVGLKPKSSAGMHFAVVAGAGDGKVWLNDPTSRKARRLKLAKFQHQWELAGGWMLLAAPAGVQ